MAELASRPITDGEGKMLGVLLAETAAGERVELRAFSGMLDGRPFAEGYVGPTRPAWLTERAESVTLHRLSVIGEELAGLDVTGALGDLQAARRSFDREIASAREQRREGKRRRAEQRRGWSADDERQHRAEFERISQREGGLLRALIRQRRLSLEPLLERLADVESRRRGLRRERRLLSRTLQASMHDLHGLVNFAGRHRLLRDFFPASSGVPTGTGECCAPKLLQEAALRGLRPVGLAEFWWGPPRPGGGREQGRFYPPCDEKCAPLLGHLLCGRENPHPAIPILFEDDAMIAVDKPPGLLSVPGRTADRADSVETRLLLLRPAEPDLRAVHRLDQATSGVLLLARTPEAYRRLSAAFAEGAVHKEYRARVRGSVDVESGEIRLPLRADPRDRPRQIICEQEGRPASSRFEVVGRGSGTVDLRLLPRTGRTHQLRVHCADPRGLDAPILGDYLYGRDETGGRLALHAHRIRLRHPLTGRPLEIQAPLPSLFGRRVQRGGLRGEKKSLSAFE